LLFSLLQWWLCACPPHSFMPGMKVRGTAAQTAIRELHRLTRQCANGYAKYMRQGQWRDVIEAREAEQPGRRDFFPHAVTQHDGNTLPMCLHHVCIPVLSSRHVQHSDSCDLKSPETPCQHLFSTHCASILYWLCTSAAHTAFSLPHEGRATQLSLCSGSCPAAVNSSKCTINRRLRPT
jgi:hypothetical protein